MREYYPIDSHGKEIKETLLESERLSARGGGNSSQETSSTTDSSLGRKAETMQFLARKPLYKMSNLVLPETTAGQLKTLHSRFENQKLVYETWGFAEIDPAGRHIAFNLYGPPGTGKTMCVEALAAEWKKMVIDVNYAEIESKYVGDTGKNITAAFQAARQQGALLFFDEADSILGQRMTSVTQAADQAVNVARAVMLKQLDAFDGIVAFATNLPRNFDSAFVRRIPIHIEIPLPDWNGRRRLWEKLVPLQAPFRAKMDFDKLADNSEGLAGGDLKNAVVNGACQIAALYSGNYTDCDINRIFLDQLSLVQKTKLAIGRSVQMSREVVSLEEEKHE